MTSRRIFEVTDQPYANGDPLRCSYCDEVTSKLVVLPLATRPGMEDRIEAADGNELWMGICLRCVDGMHAVLTKN